MKSLIQFFKRAFEISAMSQEDYYLSQAQSPEDLERRLREIDRGIAPFQKTRFLQHYM